MRTCRSTLTIGIFTALMMSMVYAQDVDVQAQLVEQGQYWQARSDSQRATEAWQKVLRLDARHVDALYGMGLAHVRQNQPRQAQDYLARLLALSPVPWQARQLEQDIAMMKPENLALLDEARRLADAGERDEATKMFRKLFAGRSPEGNIGREYYNNLAFNPADWPEARRGMERLMRQWPDDSILALFYARQLIRYEDSRARGARLLARLTRRPDIAGGADESWRLALIWMGPPNASQVPLFEEFLRAHPDDQEIRALMHKGRQQATGTSHNPLVASGLRALERGDQDAAEQAFQERLASQPNDYDALGGLGVVRQQQGRYAEAEQLLTRAIGKGGRQWKAALDSVRYWSLLQQGRDLQAKGQMARAEEAVTQAIRLNPRPVDGPLTLADIQAQAERYDEAITGYRQVLVAQPGHPQAIRGLVGVLSQTGQAEEALRLLESLSPEEQAKFGDPGRLRSLRATQLAAIAEQRGDLQGAQDALRDALQADPENVWTRFSLARLHLRMAEAQKARVLMDAFVATHPGNIDALYASALLSVELEEWAEAQKAIERIPAARRTADMDALSNQIMLTLQVRQAVALARGGQRQRALTLLDHLQPMAEDSMERTATLASAYADSGDTERAQAMMHALVAQTSTPSNELMLHYAAILLKTDEDAQVYTILSELQNKPMGGATRKRYDDMLYLYRIRQADRLREAGDLATAYEMLAPALMQRPGDAAATSALARMYTANGDNAKAFDLYRPLVQRHPQDVGILLAAADAAVLARDRGFAGRTLKQVIKLHNTDPVALTEAARIYRAMGHNNEAKALLRKAVAIEQSDQRMPGVPGVGPNPFLERWMQRAQARRIVPTVVPPPAETFLNGEHLMAIMDNEVPPPADVGQGGRGTPGMATAFTHTAAQPGTRYGAQSSTQVMPMDDSLSPAQRALNDIKQSRAAYVALDVDVRSNDSEPGISKLTDVEMPLEINLAVGNGRLGVHLTPVMLDAGRMSDAASPRFGSALAGSHHIGSQRDEGIGLAVSYAVPDAGFKADIGTTPSGFMHQNVIGGVSIERPFGFNSNLRYGVTLSRRAVTDSLTSFAGSAVAPNATLADVADMVTDITGVTTDESDIVNGTWGDASVSPELKALMRDLPHLSWGGVTASGARAQLGHDDLDAGVYGYTAFHRLSGHHVKSNTRAELGGGAYRHLRNTADNRFTVGLSATALRYKNNQNFFTYGYGGYFSPQNYVALGFPLTWMQRSERFTYQAKGSVGLQYFQQDGGDYFPNHRDFQEMLDRAGLNVYSVDQSNSGISYNLEISGEYRFTLRTFLGGRFVLDNSRDYRQYDVGMYLRYSFEKMDSKPLALPVSPYRSPYSN